MATLHLSFGVPAFDANSLLLQFHGSGFWELQYKKKNNMKKSLENFEILTKSDIQNLDLF